MGITHTHPESTLRMTRAEWLAKGKELFGDDPKDWRFKCCICGHVQTYRDFQALEKFEKDPGSVVFFSCIGRWIPGSSDAFTEVKEKGGPCNYTCGGLFRLGPLLVTDEDGVESNIFGFDEEQA